MEQLNNTPVMAGVAGVVLVSAAVIMCSNGNSRDTKEPAIGKKNDSKKTAKAKSSTKETTEDSKKTKKKEKKKGGVEAVPSTTKQSAEGAAESGTKQQSAPVSKKQRKKNGGRGGDSNANNKAAAKGAAAATDPVEEAAEPEIKSQQQPVATQAPPPLSEGWASVGSSKKDKRKEKAAAAAAAAAAEEDAARARADAEATSAALAEAQAVAAASSQKAGDSAATEGGSGSSQAPKLPSATMLVDPKKLGVLIGPKGVTLKRIEEVSGCRVQLPERSDVEGNPAVKSIAVSIQGPNAEAVGVAEKLVLSMCSKGFAAGLVEGGDFCEKVMELHPRVLPELVGSGGNTIKTLRDACQVHVNLPPPKKSADYGGSERPVKVTIAGPKAGVVKAEGAVNDIVNRYYSTITHPGMVHAEFKVEEWQIPRFCGKGGANVRHIQGDSRARVFVPRDWAPNKNVVVVGYPAQVDVAKKHVTRILQDISDMANRVSSEEGMAAAYRAGKDNHFEDDQEEEPVEEWMRDYMYKR